jgi:hypothetical protein
MCIPYNVSVNLQGCSGISVTELPLDYLGRRSRVEQER